MLRILALFLTLLAMLPVLAIGQQRPFHAMGKDEFSSFLDLLNSDLARWKAPISRIDVTELHMISYEEGKSIEGFQSICLQNLDQIQFDTTTLNQKPSLTFLISLIAHIDDFHHNLDSLEHAIGIRAFPERTGQDIPKTRKWADGLIEISKDLYPLRKRLLEHSLAVALATDVILNAPSANH